MSKVIINHSDTQALKSVIDEMHSQDGQWGLQNHQIFTWMAILGEEFGKLCQASLRNKLAGGDVYHVREKAVNVAAVALQIIERIDEQSHRT